MTGWQEQLIELIQTSPIGTLYGWRLSFDDANHAHLHLPYNPNLDHALRGVHGGVIATLLDTSGWCASSIWHPEVWVATVEFSVHLVRQATHCDLHAEGWVVHSGKRLDIVEMKVVDATDGTLYATGSGTVIVLRDLPFRRDESRSSQP